MRRHVGATCVRLAVLAACGAASLLLPASAATADIGPCRAIGDRGPQGGRATSAPPPAPALFPADFTSPTDCEWGFRVGGWGGIRRAAPLKHDPVIFVHGNHSDAVDWFGVADAFKAAGYSDQELWAISYNGLGGQVDGAPIVCACPPSQRAIDYMRRPDVAPLAAEGGQYAANDVNVPDLYAFTEAVLAYTGAGHVQFVGHSLGVTVIRKMLFDHRELFRRVSAVVSIAGGNHGTSLCRGMEATLYSCDEVAPGSAWLRQLNSIGESPGPTKWMSIYNGSNNLDPFFVQTPTYDDRQAPHLDGAINLTYPDAYHSDLRVRPDIVATYLKFLASNSQQGRAASHSHTSSMRTSSRDGSRRRLAPTGGARLPATGLPPTPALGAALLMTAGLVSRTIRAQ